jgi:hypothetical protein
MDNETLNSIRLIALNEANDKTYNAWYRSVCRWYSREFHTPLTQVEFLSEEEVFKTWYEDLFWKMKNGTPENQEAFSKFIETTLHENDPEIEDLEAKAEEEDEDWYKEELEALNGQISEKHNKINESEIEDSFSRTVENPNLKEELHSILNDDESDLDEG